jgi:hypothetical protein
MCQISGGLCKVGLIHLEVGWNRVAESFLSSIWGSFTLISDWYEYSRIVVYWLVLGTRKFYERDLVTRID